MQLQIFFFFSFAFDGIITVWTEQFAAHQLPVRLKNKMIDFWGCFISECWQIHIKNPQLYRPSGYMYNRLDPLYLYIVVMYTCKNITKKNYIILYCIFSWLIFAESVHLVLILVMVLILVLVLVLVLVLFWWHCSMLILLEFNNTLHSSVCIPAVNWSQMLFCAYLHLS